MNLISYSWLDFFSDWPSTDLATNILLWIKGKLLLLLLLCLIRGMEPEGDEVATNIHE